MDLNSVACVNCQAVTTNDGKTVWVCENCNTVNQPSVDTLVQTPAASAPAPASSPAPATPAAAPVAEDRPAYMDTSGNLTPPAATPAPAPASPTEPTPPSSSAS